jgi:uncharacterized protein YjbI with pentapeptide repeats
MSEQGATREPDWPGCGTSGCIGVRVDGQEACLAHVDPKTRKTIRAALKPGADVDLRGTPIDGELLGQLLAALCPDNDRPVLGDAKFDRATFTGAAEFGSVWFTGTAGFWEAEFSRVAEFAEAQFVGVAVFAGARFSREASFARARFSREARFDGARFSERAVFKQAQFDKAAQFNYVQFRRDAEFGSARFTGMAWFVEAKFDGMGGFTDAESSERATFTRAEFKQNVGFGRARFSGITTFEGARFTGEAWFGATQFHEAWFEGTQFDGVAGFVGTRFTRVAGFTGAQFKQARSVGPLFAGEVVLDRTFEQAVTIEAASATLSCVDTRFNDTATLRLRYAETVVDGAVFTRPSTIAFAEDTFTSRDEMEEEAFDEGAAARAADGRSPRPLSLRGVDVTGMTLGDLDLSACSFQGSHNLDKIRIEGTSPFTSTPRGWKFGRVGGQGVPVWRWTHRWALAEEHHWRASRDLPAAPNGRPHPKRAGWYPPAVQPPKWLAVRTGQRVQPLPPGRIAMWYRALRKGWEDSKNEPGAADFYYGEMEMRRLGSGTHWGERVILTLYWLVSGYGLRGLRALAWLAAVIVGLGILFQLVGFARHPSPPTVWGSLLYAARSTLSIADPEAQLTGWGKLLQLILRLAGPVLLGLALLAVRNRVKR